MQCQAIADTLSVSVMTERSISALCYCTIIPHGALTSMYIAEAAAAVAPRRTGPVPAILYRSGGVEAIYCSAVGQRCAQPLTLSACTSHRPPVTGRPPASLYRPAGRAGHRPGHVARSSSSVFADETRKLDIRLALSNVLLSFILIIRRPLLHDLP